MNLNDCRGIESKTSMADFFSWFKVYTFGVQYTIFPRPSCDGQQAFRGFIHFHILFTFFSFEIYTISLNNI